MELKTQFQIKNNPNMARFLRENSKFYKELNRNPKSIDILDRRMKEAYRLTPQDKLQDLQKRIEMLKDFMDILN